MNQDVLVHVGLLVANVSMVSLAHLLAHLNVGLITTLDPNPILTPLSNGKYFNSVIESGEKREKALKMLVLSTF